MRFRVVVFAALAASLGLASSGARAAPPPVEAYGKLPALELMRLSPSGDKFAFVAVAKEKRQVYVATVAGKLLASGQAGQNKVRDIAWAGDDHVLIFSSATADLRADYGYKYELGAALQLDLKTNKSWTVFQDSPGIAHTIFGYYGSSLVKDRWYGYFGGVTFDKTVGNYTFDHGWPDLYRVDLQTGAVGLVARGNKLLRHWSVAADGAVVAHDLYDQPSGQWRLLAGDGFGKVLMERSSPQDDVGLEGLGSTPGTVLITDDTGDRSTAEEVPLAGGAPKALFGQVGVMRYLTDPVDGTLIGALTEQEPGAVFLDAGLQARYAAARRAFPNVRMALESYSRDLAQVIVQTEGDGDSGTYWFVDLTTGRAHSLGAAHPDVKAEDVGPTSLVEFKAADGLVMDGVLTLPPGREAKNLALVVMPHGGPIGIWDRPGFDNWAQAFASRGYAVFQPNYRGSGGHGAVFQRAGYGEWGRKMLSDISDGVAALAARGVVDPRRACIVGASYGGYAALAGVTLQQGLYRCAVSVAGPANMSSFFNWQTGKLGDRSAFTRYWRAATGADTQGDGVMKAISPATLAGRADAPVLLIHGKDDTVVPIEQSRQMESALQAAGKSVEFMPIEGGDHWDLHEDARLATVTASVAFVEKYNPPN